MIRIVILSLLLTACGTARRGAPIVGETTVPNDTVKLGQITFYRHCHACHPGGTQGIGPSLTNKPLPDVAVRAQVRAGLGAMPGFPEDEISDREVDAINEYLEWLRDLEPRIDYDRS